MAKKQEEQLAFDAEGLLALASSLKTEYITPDELQAPMGLWIRELTGHEREVITRMGGKVKMYDDGAKEIDLSTMNPEANVKMCLCALVTDETGQTQMFRQGRVDADKLKMLPAHTLDTIVRHVRSLSAMDQASIDAAKKNSKTQNSEDGLS